MKRKMFSQIHNKGSRQARVGITGHKNLSLEWGNAGPVVMNSRDKVVNRPATNQRHRPDLFSPRISKRRQLWPENCTLIKYM